MDMICIIDNKENRYCLANGSNNVRADYVASL